MKKLLSILLCFLMILPVLAMVNISAADAKISSFGVNVNSSENNTIDTIKWFNRDGVNYLFLPSDTDLDNITVFFDATAPVYVNGVELKNGETTSVFNEPNKEYTLTCNGSSYRLFVLCSQNLPAVYLTTSSGSLNYIHSNKENKEPGSIRIYENGKQVLDSALKQIKGRGNTTWRREKKPYNIKFDKKTSVLGMAKAKKWTLLANDFDTALLRNNAILGIAESLPFLFTSDFRNVDLYINGEYKGNYLICESVEIGSSRLDITNLENLNEDANPGLDLDTCAHKSSGNNLPGTKRWVDIPVNPEDITGGYLLELDYEGNYYAEISGFETLNGQNITIKSPELASKSEVDYISAYYQEAEDALCSRSGYNSLGKHYSEYFDMDSFVMMYILEEYSLDWDAGQTSCYIYKNSSDNKFYVAPAWDFDMSLGNRNIGLKRGINLLDSDVWFANTNIYNKSQGVANQSYVDCLFTLAYQRHSDFRSLVKEKWADFTKICSDEYIASIGAYSESITASAVMNAYRWNRYTTSPSYAEKVQRYTDDVKELTTFMTNRIAALSKGFGTDGAIFCYDSNGGDNKVLDEKIYSVGDIAVVKNYNDAEHPIERSGYTFSGWNTEPDGTGVAYNPGDKIQFTTDSITLYAQWKNQTVGEATVSFWQKIVNFFNRIFEWFANLFR